MTYDWGLTSDIARKNISLICSKLKIGIYSDLQILRKKKFYKKKSLCMVKETKFRNGSNIFCRR